ncbi:DUF2778 domain-containing protein [Xanthobacter sp. TB0139]|uniref:DUF2778 domain-containing protein n=1 Tax=Xanthobacter sp. TB0139 TaxID=3459178 RepID=UPI004039164F
MTHPMWDRNEERHHGRAGHDDDDQVSAGRFFRPEREDEDPAGWARTDWSQSAPDEDMMDEPASRQGWFDALGKSRFGRLMPVAAIGLGVVGVALLVATQGVAWISSSPDIETSPVSAELSGAETDTLAQMRREPVTNRYSMASVGGVVGDTAGLPPSGWVDIDPNWVLRSPSSGVAGRFSGMIVSRDVAPEARVVVSVPVPAPNPMGATDTPLLDSDMATAPLPLSHPLGRSERQQMASLGRTEAPPEASATAPAARSPERVAPPRRTTPPGRIPSHTNVTLPTRENRFAVYDISGQVVYMPNGDQLEAHSGLGDKFDNPRYVAVRNLGPTPPNTYRLTPREALFHGVAALRMHPVGSGRMYGRNGFLTHSYLMGARGDSNGCISFKDYDRFLAAYRRGEITHMVVVTSLPDDVKPARSKNLFSWLLPRGG